MPSPEDINCEKKTNQYTLVANDIETIKRKINNNNNIVAASKNPKDQCYSACTYIYQLFKKENVKLTFILLLYWEKKPMMMCQWIIMLPYLILMAINSLSTQQ